MSALFQVFASSRLATLASSACLFTGAHFSARNNFFSTDKNMNKTGELIFDYPLSVTAGAIALSVLGTGIAGTAVFGAFCLLPIAFKATILGTEVAEALEKPYPKLNRAANNLNDVARLISKLVVTLGCFYVALSPLSWPVVALSSTNNPVISLFIAALSLDKPETVIWPFAGAVFMTFDLCTDVQKVAAAIHNRVLAGDPRLTTT